MGGFLKPPSQEEQQQEKAGAQQSLLVKRTDAERANAAFFGENRKSFVCRLSNVGAVYAAGPQQHREKECFLWSALPRN